MDTKICCALIGHSPMLFRFGWDEEDPLCIRLKLVLLQQLQALHLNGITQFMTACDPGIGLWGAELVNILRDGDGELHLFCVLPHEEQAKNSRPKHALQAAISYLS